MSIREKIKPTDLCKRTVVLSSADMKPERSPQKMTSELCEEICTHRIAATLGIGLDALADSIDYDSPIEIMNQRITTLIEDNVMKVVYSADIKVDKQELIRALRYDRNQYQKGYEAAKSDEPNAEWIRDSSQLSCTCSNCRRSYNIQTMFSISPDYGELPKYCPDCGHKMRRKKEERK